jgi:hypothetical protein
VSCRMMAVMMLLLMMTMIMMMMMMTAAATAAFARRASRRVTARCSYMADRMGLRAKELVVEKALVEEAAAKEEVWCCGGKGRMHVWFMRCCRQLAR